MGHRFSTSLFDCKGRLYGGMILTGVLGLAMVSAVPCRADLITLKSDGATLAAAMGPGTPSGAVAAQLDTPNTTGLSFSPALVGAFGTFTPVPTGAPSGTEVINIPPGDGENGYFEVTFTLPAGFSSAAIAGAANVDDTGRMFLNGNAISPSIFSGDPNQITEFGNATFSSSNAAFFQAGQNVLLLSDANTGGGPSGAAFYATVTFTSSVPEPGAVALLIGLGGSGAMLVARRRK